MWKKVVTAFLSLNGVRGRSFVLLRTDEMRGLELLEQERHEGRERETKKFRCHFNAELV